MLLLLNKFTAAAAFVLPPRPPPLAPHSMPSASVELLPREISAPTAELVHAQPSTTPNARNPSACDAAPRTKLQRHSCPLSRPQLFIVPAGQTAPLPCRSAGRRRTKRTRLTLTLYFPTSELLRFCLSRLALAPGSRRISFFTRRRRLNRRCRFSFTVKTATIASLPSLAALRNARQILCELFRTVSSVVAPGGSLNFTQTLREDMGMYVCLAANGISAPDARKVFVEVSLSAGPSLQLKLVRSKAPRTASCQRDKGVAKVGPSSFGVVFDLSATKTQERSELTTHSSGRRLGWAKVTPRSQAMHEVRTEHLPSGQRRWRERREQGTSLVHL
ncbi:hypothetical protein BIW11_02691 [Tropilaelaps mercedesae]|uniref:Uncharacterized protein n=1 Tax=Tropilaelaps mercedesae TaxID=418985 RepID=A0A1V9XZ68_9ACAR|nr:hypothetical protein BIW11_02691 [Tropilaelaps mercedesae]